MQAQAIHFRKMNGLGNDFVVLDARARALAPRAGGGARHRRPQRGHRLRSAHRARAVAPGRCVHAHLERRWRRGRSLRQCRALRGGARRGRKRRARGQHRDGERGARLRPSTATAASPSTWARRASPGTRFRWPSRSTTRGASSCRSGRSTRRCCIRRRWSMSAIRIACSSSRTSRRTISPRFGPMLEHHPLFPERANISLVQVLGAAGDQGAHLGARRRADAGLRHGGLRRRRGGGAPRADRPQGAG